MSFKIRDSHWEVLLSFLERNKDFANGRFTGAQGREKNKALWAELAQLLNSQGYGERTPDKWQKTWTDFKYQIKKKGSSLNSDRGATGGGGPSTNPFNAFELRALEILGGEQFYSGMGVEELGVSRGTAVPGPSNAPVTTAPSNAPVVTTTPSSVIISKDVPTSSKRPRQNEPLNISSPLTEHDYTPQQKRKKTRGVDEAYKETIKILKEIKDVVDVRLSKIRDVINNKLQEVVDAKIPKQNS